MGLRADGQKCPKVQRSIILQNKLVLAWLAIASKFCLIFSVGNLKNCCNNLFHFQATEILLTTRIIRLLPGHNATKYYCLKLKCRETDTWKLCERLSAAYFIAPLPYKGISCDQNFGSCIHYWLSNQSMVSERKLVISYYHVRENCLIE